MDPFDAVLRVMGDNEWVAASNSTVRWDAGAGYSLNTDPHRWSSPRSDTRHFQRRESVGCIEHHRDYDLEPQTKEKRRLCNHAGIEQTGCG